MKNAAQSATRKVSQPRLPEHDSALEDLFEIGFEDQLGSPCLPVKTFVKDDIICSQGERLTCLYVIKQGEVMLTRLSPDGRETLLSVLGAGEFFGEAALLESGLVANFNAYALGRATLLAVTQQRFMHLANDARTWRRIMESLLRRCDDAWTQIEAMGCTRVEDKVRAVLHWLTHRVGVGTSEGIRIDLNQTQLAQMTGCARETLNRQLGELKRRGILAIKGRRRHEVLLVLKPEAFSISAC